jgi:DNA mismatch repair protein MutS2
MRATLEVGDVVRVKSLNQKGEILSLDEKEAEVAVGRLHMRASLADLELSTEKKEAEEKAESSISVNVAEPPGMELDIRGYRLDEGVSKLESYLDSAYLADMPYVRIIHGKGTGRLREAVRRALQQNRYARSWEEGKTGEGGAGVTVVRLQDE